MTITKQGVSYNATRATNATLPPAAAPTYVDAAGRSFLPVTLSAPISSMTVVFTVLPMGAVESASIRMLWRQPCPGNQVRRAAVLFWYFTGPGLHFPTDERLTGVVRVRGHAYNTQPDTRGSAWPEVGRVINGDVTVPRWCRPAGQLCHGHVLGAVPVRMRRRMGHGHVRGAAHLRHTQQVGRPIASTPVLPER